jgi:hypothetical protein
MPLCYCPIVPEPFARTVNAEALRVGKQLDTVLTLMSGVRHFGLQLGGLGSPHTYERYSLVVNVSPSPDPCVSFASRDWFIPHTVGRKLTIAALMCCHEVEGP